MSGVSPSTGVLAARIGLEAAIRAALDGEAVDIYAGFLGVPETTDWVALGEANADIDPANVSSRRQLDERITLAVNVGAWVAGNDDDTARAAWDRAFALLDLIQRYVRTGDNTTLGDAVLWCLPGSFDADGDAYSGGFQVEIAATFICSHRVRT
ncbi:hypothetical protein [Microbacterium allomyrinae]|uniref:Uncharacterized protein n=1 Tax=Microbacterium allomyrinae TaxID=2830666 RepID=A0A9X1LRS6_9MICO|nr:hypothetical protein [Microbacterium allomyrinae]MCC2030617.1 hypothetical protein [Microbacterium allomyrinae]